MPVTRVALGRMSDRGETTTQLVVLVPVLFLLALVVVQAAMWFHAANVAEAAAARGAAAGAAFAADPGSAADAATAVVADNRADLAGAPSVETDTEQVVVSVQVRVPRLVPFFPDTVRRTQLEPRERFVPETER